MNLLCAIQFRKGTNRTQETLNCDLFRSNRNNKYSFGNLTTIVEEKVHVTKTYERLEKNTLEPTITFIN